MIAPRLKQLLAILTLPTAEQVPREQSPISSSSSSSINGAMTKTIVLITGGSTGLGYYAVQQLAANGSYHVLMGSRSVEKAESAIECLAADTSYTVSAADIDAVQIDVTSDDSIAAAAGSVARKYGYIDILMVNAGIAHPDNAGAVPEGGKLSLRELYRSQFDTNVFGAAVTVDTFLPLLRRAKDARRGKRISFTSSGLASLTMAAEARSGGKAPTSWPIYRSTKTALSMILLAYSRRLESEGFTVTAADPGRCRQTCARRRQRTMQGPEADRVYAL